MAPKPDRELGEARASIDRGHARAALKRLDRARRGYLKLHDRDGLEHVLRMAELVDGKDERARIERLNLEYAVKQNLRQESRREAQARGEPWSDPYPALEAPTEHTGIVLTRTAKIAIGVGVAVGTAVVAAFIAAAVIGSGSGTRVTLRLLNDTPEAVTLRGCNDSDCTSTWMHADLDAGQATERSVDADDLVDVFRIGGSGGDERCLPVRVHDAYQNAETQVLLARISWASLCPGTTVLPESAPETGL